MQINLKRDFAIMLPLVWTCLACAAGKVTAVSTKQSGGVLAVQVLGNGLTKPSTQWKNGAFVLHFQGTLTAKPVIVEPDRGGILRFSCCQVGPNVDVAVRPMESRSPRVVRTAKGWLISFERRPKESGPSWFAKFRAETRVKQPEKKTSFAPPAASAGDDVLCSLQVTEMDPALVLQTLSTQTHTNLLLLTTPDTKLTISMTQVPLSEMIRHICALCDLSFLRVDKAYVIATADRLKKAYPVEWEALHPTVKQEAPPPVEEVTETYRAGFVTAENLAKTLTALFTGKAVSFVCGPEPLNPNVVNQDSSKATGDAATMLTKDQSNGSRILLVSGEKELVADALAMAKRLDKPRQQVMIAVTIHDISDDDLRDLGVTWDFGTETFQETTTKKIGFGTIGRTPLTFSTVLTALDQKQRSKLLAAPTVSVLDGERAFVLIGDRISYPVLVGYSQNNAPIFSKEEERVGIYLQVSASIGLDGTVTLSLYPQVSTITGYLNVNGASYPQVSTREAQTTLMLKSGETIVMGGLYSDEEISQLDKVPFLSQIPILGEIFQHRRTTKTKSQVIITVTPTVLTGKTP